MKCKLFKVTVKNVLVVVAPDGKEADFIACSNADRGNLDYATTDVEELVSADQLEGNERDWLDFRPHPPMKGAYYEQDCSDCEDREECDVAVGCHLCIDEDEMKDKIYERRVGEVGEGGRPRIKLGEFEYERRDRGVWWRVSR